MRSKSLKVNYNHMREHIRTNYFHYLDILYKSFLITLVHFTTEETPYGGTTIMENSQYTQLLSELYNVHTSGGNILEILTVQDNHILMDLQVYLQEFLITTHNFKEFNIYQITIDPKYNLVITNKQLGHYVL